MCDIDEAKQWSCLAAVSGIRQAVMLTWGTHTLRASRPRRLAILPLLDILSVQSKLEYPRVYVEELLVRF
jgi:hypothetical protein